MLAGSSRASPFDRRDGRAKKGIDSLWVAEDLCYVGIQDDNHRVAIHAPGEAIRLRLAVVEPVLACELARGLATTATCPCPFRSLRVHAVSLDER